VVHRNWDPPFGAAAFAAALFDRNLLVMAEANFANCSQVRYIWAFDVRVLSNPISIRPCRSRTRPMLRCAAISAWQSVGKLAGRLRAALHLRHAAHYGRARSDIETFTRAGRLFRAARSGAHVRSPAQSAAGHPVGRLYVDPQGIMYSDRSNAGPSLQFAASAYPGEVDTGSPTRICAEKRCHRENRATRGEPPRRRRGLFSSVSIDSRWGKSETASQQKRTAQGAANLGRNHTWHRQSKDSSANRSTRRRSRRFTSRSSD
jgi:hypothetical protein